MNFHDSSNIVLRFSKKKKKKYYETKVYHQFESRNEEKRWSGKEQKYFPYFPLEIKVENLLAV